jgi:hypothetical protein
LHNWLGFNQTLVMENKPGSNADQASAILTTGRLEAHSDAILANAATLLLTGSARPRSAAALRRSPVGPVLYLIAAVVAVVSAPVPLVVTAVVAGYVTVTPRHLRRPVP